MKRLSFEQLYLSIAQLLSQKSIHPTTKVGCLITTYDNMEMLSAGINGLEVGGKNKIDSNKPGMSGTIHSEINACIFNKSPRTQEKTVWLTHSPCIVCARALINLGGVKKLVYLNKYRSQEGLKLLKKNGIIVKHYTKKL